MTDYGELQSMALATCRIAAMGVLLDANYLLTTKDIIGAADAIYCRTMGWGE